MEGEAIAIVISCCVSGLLLLWKLIKRLRKSKCYIEDKNGKKIVLDFSSVEKEIEETTRELSEEQREKIKKILNNTLKKVSSGEFKKTENL